MPTAPTIPIALEQQSKGQVLDALNLQDHESDMASWKRWCRSCAIPGPP